MIEENSRRSSLTVLHSSFGITGKMLYDKYGPFKDIKVRFAAHLFCGETSKSAG